MAHGSSDTSGSSCRFSDVTSGSQRKLPPIQGFEEKLLVSIEEAVKPLTSLVAQVEQMVWTIKDDCKQPKDGLTPNESASIMLYTLEWAPSESSFYFILNTALRSEDRRKLVPWFLYLRLFIHALSKLPSSSPRVLYRGVKLDLSELHSKGHEFVWWPFSSCTESIDVLENHIGQTGKRTMFNIICRSAKDISRHSHYQAENEFILYPARQFKVKSLFNAGNDLHIIQLEETEPPFPLFRMPPTEKPTSSINILLLGEKGVGKSTFINAFVNYLTYKTVAQAQSNRPIVLIPLSFLMMTNDQFEQRTVKFGDFDHLDPSITQRCQSYTSDLNQNDGKKLCIIDTPSFEGRQDLDQDDSNNIRHILDYINNLTHLNAICFLFKPDESRLNSYQSYFARILNRLGPDARRNVIFCFTNTGSNFSCLGRTAPLLRSMLATLSMNDITLSRTNTFLFDNESFRYLVAAQNGIMFDDDDKSEYTESWPESVTESNRLLDYIQTQLIPCRIAKK